MKEVQKTKQSLWILTMLTVMVVLSAYYLVSDPYVSTDLTNNVQEIPDITADIITEDVTNNTELVDQIGINGSDLLIGLKMERSSNRSKQYDQLTAMMQSNVTEETIAEIQDQIEDLQSIEEAEFVLEKLIVADGYQDAVVLSNENNVDVIIQTNSLSNNEAVKIIKMVSDRLEIPAVNVHIRTVPIVE